MTHPKQPLDNFISECFQCFNFRLFKSVRSESTTYYSSNPFDQWPSYTMAVQIMTGIVVTDEDRGESLSSCL